MQPITTVQIAFRLWPLSLRTDIHIKEIKIYKLNNFTFETATVPIIASGGDKITIDTKKFFVLKNGELANNLIDLQSQMFPFRRGVNMLEVTPSDAMTITTKFRETYL
jgi:phage-related protein